MSDELKLMQSISDLNKKLKAEVSSLQQQLAEAKRHKDDLTERHTRVVDTLCHADIQIDKLEQERDKLRALVEPAQQLLDQLLHFGSINNQVVSTLNHRLEALERAEKEGV